MRDVILKSGLSPELEEVLPIDRVISIDNSNIVYLADKQFVINENDIEREI